MIALEKATKPLKGDIFVPGDKSISHRSIMFGAISKGTTEVTGFLESADCLSTIDCFKKLGVEIEHTVRPTHGVPTITVHGKGLHGLKKPDSTLYTGNSGTTTRLMSGILAAQPFDSMITGDMSIEKRPMARIMKPLTSMGAEVVSVRGNGCAPLAFTGGKELRGINYHAEGDSVVYEPALSRNHTEIMLASFGADIHNEVARDGSAVSILHPGMPLVGRKVNVPGDISSAAYFIVAALMVPGSEILIRNVGINKTRAGILNVLDQMGADITLLNVDESSEPKADILIKYSELHGNENNQFIISGKEIPTMIDELPVVAVLAATGNFDTIIKDAAELKVKESNRIDTVVEGLRSMGCDIEATDDGMIIHGGKPLKGADINCHSDHRIAMSFAIASLAATGTTRILDDECVGISYPTFFKDLQGLL